ncbi:hypothetical protein [Paraburkholderia kirstenboschensis]|uniref:Uncharacterized protein n=1 Tax=Paraburkholderia kirstenboschensis TaxID=1245436 RepID=A0ABZ0EDW7_9BURK|nr:hypothetical protein [Paraburkholderia kirstenboschensis]WOD15402.1 hypothetical protein RW095_19090 [Paraburkholderia kirstenboschensis]
MFEAILPSHAPRPNQFVQDCIFAATGKGGQNPAKLRWDNGPGKFTVPEW